MRPIFPHLLLLLAATLPTPSRASEEDFLAWQSLTLKSPDHPQTGVVQVDASCPTFETFQKLQVTVFGQTRTLDEAALKRLQGYPLSSLVLSHEAGYAELGGHTVHLKFTRSYYNEAKQFVNASIIVSFPKNAPMKITELPPKK